MSVRRYTIQYHACTSIRPSMIMIICTVVNSIRITINAIKRYYSYLACHEHNLLEGVKSFDSYTIPAYQWPIFGIFSCTGTIPALSFSSYHIIEIFLPYC